MGTDWVGMAEAVARLGPSEHAVRRRSKAGELRARQVPTPQGHRWQIEVPRGDAPREDQRHPAQPSQVAQGAPGGRGHSPGRNGASTGTVTVDAEAATPPGSGDAPALPAVRRAEEMEAYTERLLAPWRERVADLSHANGRPEERAAQADHLAQAAQAAQGAAEQQAALAREQAARLEGELRAVRAELEAACAAAARPWWRFWG